MKTLHRFLLVLALFQLAACGSFLAAFDSGPIEDDPGKRTAGARVEDELIETKAKVNINAASEALDKSHFDAISFNGYVLLVGQVPDEASKRLAEETVSKIRSVRFIYNELEISGNTSIITRTSDAWLTAKVKTKLLASAEIPGNRVKVVTENGVVHLMGLLSHSEAELVTEAVRTVGGVQKVVEIYELID